MSHFNEIEKLIADHVRSLIDGWQRELPGVRVVLGGSMVSGLLIVDEQTQVIDVDVRFLTDSFIDDPISSMMIRERIERATGLIYRKAIDVDDWPSGKSAGVMLEEKFILPGIPFPLEVEGCLRSGQKYVGWHQHFQSVLSQSEILALRAQKLSLRHDKAKYKEMKIAVLSEVKKRCVERGIVSSAE